MWLCKYLLSFSDFLSRQFPTGSVLSMYIVVIDKKLAFNNDCFSFGTNVPGGVCNVIFFLVIVYTYLMKTIILGTWFNIIQINISQSWYRQKRNGITWHPFIIVRPKGI